MARESFVFYKSFYDAISNIEDKNLKSDIYEAICELGLNENVIELDNNVGKIIMGLITPQIMANNHKYNNSFAGGRPKKYDEEEIIDSIVNKKLGNADISRQIGCSVSTVKNIRQRLLSGNYRQKPNVNVNVNENDYIPTSTPIVECVQENFGRLLSPVEYEEILSWEDNELTRYAIKQAVLGNKCATKYISRILSAYERENIKTVQQAQERERKYIEAQKSKQSKNYKNTVETKPKWFDKQITKQKATEEERREIEELLKELGD